MEISNVAAAKVEDRELLNTLRRASPASRINNLSIFLDTDKPGPGSLTDRLRAAAQEGKAKLEGIPDLKIVTYVEIAGYALVSGTAESIAKALDLGCVRGAERGDKPMFRGAIRK